MAGSKIHDLSHVLVPGKSGRFFDVTMISAEEIAPIIRLEDQWYIMHMVEMVNHLATHVEVPYHLIRHGADLTEQPIESFMGPMVCLDLVDRCREPRHGITRKEVQAAAEKAGGIRPGDIVFHKTGWDVEFGREKYLDSPYFDLSAIEWEIDQGMKLIGVDCAGIENLDSSTHECHLAVFRRGIPLIENLTNLGALPGPRATVLAIPIAVKGLESFPVRVVALEDGGS
jgi:kynurenine formamidase